MQDYDVKLRAVRALIIEKGICSRMPRKIINALFPLRFIDNDDGKAYHLTYGEFKKMAVRICEEDGMTEEEYMLAFGG